MPQLQRTTPRLLRTVSGKPHASSEDHDENSAQLAPPSAQPPVLTEAEINADPVSSADEASVQSKPVERRTTSVSLIKPRQTIGAADKAKGRKSARNTSIRVPKKGAYENGRTERARRTGLDDKENEKGSPRGLGRSRAVEEDDTDAGAEEMFGWEYARPKKRQKVTQTTTINIHARTTYGKKPATYGSQKTAEPKKSPKKSLSSMAALMKYSTVQPQHESSNEDMDLRKPPPRKSVRISSGQSPRKDVDLPKPPARKAAVNQDKNDSDSESSDISMVSNPRPLPKKKHKSTSRRDLNRDSTAKREKDALPRPPSSPGRARLGLSTQLRRYRAPSPASAQLPGILNLDPNASGSSTPLSSVPDTDTSVNPRETLQTLEKYAADMATGISVDETCPLCSAPVEPTHFREFWEGKKKSIFYQKAFCREHSRRSALELYTAKGYPEIDWSSLPERIKRHREHLVAVLRNQEYSTFRSDIKAPTRQKGMEIMEENVENGRLTGYYGTRGSRAMMEIITKQLGKVMREYEDEGKDKLLEGLGMANFVTRVLVPELVVRLVMEDLECSEEVARGVVEESGEVGELVNEDLGDDLGDLVEADSEEDEDVDEDD